MLPASGHILPDFAALARAQGYKAETFPHNQATGQAEPQVKQLA